MHTSNAGKPLHISLVNTIIKMLLVYHRFTNMSLMGIHDTQLPNRKINLWFPKDRCQRHMYP